MTNTQSNQASFSVKSVIWLIIALTKTSSSGRHMGHIWARCLAMWTPTSSCHITLARGQVAHPGVTLTVEQSVQWQMLMPLLSFAVLCCDHFPLVWPASVPPGQTGLVLPVLPVQSCRWCSQSGPASSVRSCWFGPTGPAHRPSLSIPFVSLATWSPHPVRPF